LTDAFDLTRQARWEGECSRRGEQAFLESDKANQIDGTLGNQIVPKLAERIAVLQEQGMDSIASRGLASPWAWPVQGLGARELALLTLKTALRCEALEGTDCAATLTAMARNLTTVIRDEMELARWLSEKKAEAKAGDPQARNVLAAFKKRHPSVDRHAWARWRKKVAAQRVEWDQATSIHLGTALLKALVDVAPDHFSIETRKLRGGRTQLYLGLSESTQEALADRLTRRALALPHYLPMRCPPVPWRYAVSIDDPLEGNADAAHCTTLHTRSLEGGYLIHKVPLVRTTGEDHTTVLCGAVSQADLDAVNAIQATPWRVNQFILDVMLEADRRNIQLAGLDVGRQPVVMPPRLSDAEFAVLDRDQRREYLRKRERVHAERAKVKSKTLAVADCLAVAEEFRNEPAFWYPMVKDFRHRIYSAATRGPQPQGDDVSKSLIMFSEGKPLGDTGEFWLCVRAANCFGKDKLTLEERVEWTLTHTEEIRQCTDDPFKSLWWTHAEEPWSFLATCHELGQIWASSTPSQFLSHLPCPMDGSCNGIQHLSAMGLDPIGARATNLTKGPREDIYATVAGSVARLVDQHAQDGLPSAREWLGQVTRQTVKRAVMTTPYGVTARGIRDQLVFDGLVPENASADYMRDCIRDALAGTIVAAKNIMEWLQLCAQRLAKAGLPLRWETPSGSLVEQAYHETVVERVETMCGKLTLHTSAPDVGLKAHKQALASAPNIIHSFDAAHLSMTVNAGAERGISAWAVIHDSFATHAGSSQVLASVLREQFVAIYRTNWLERLHAGFRAYAPHVDLPGPPARGSFDIDGVLDAEFFFS
jgi:DNA-directed RNA polymerase